MTAKMLFQQLLFCILLTLAAGTLPAVAENVSGDHCNDMPPPGPWIVGAGSFEHDDECNFTVDFGSTQDPIGWFTRPLLPGAGSVAINDFQIGPQFPDLLPETGFRFFDLNSPSGPVLQLELIASNGGIHLSGRWHGDAWYFFSPAKEELDTSRARSISVVVARPERVKGSEVAVYVDGAKVMQAGGIEFSDIATEARLGVITDPGPGAIGSFSFLPLF